MGLAWSYKPRIIIASGGIGTFPIAGSNFSAFSKVIDHEQAVLGGGMPTISKSSPVNPSTVYGFLPSTYMRGRHPQ